MRISEALRRPGATIALLLSGVVGLGLLAQPLAPGARVQTAQLSVAGGELRAESGTLSASAPPLGLLQAGMPAPPAFTNGTEPAEIASNFDTTVTGPFRIAYPMEPHEEYPVDNTGDEGAFRTHCEASHLGYDDPLLYPGRPGASHLHMFYGNTGLNASSTYASLRTTGDSTCGGGKLNRSGYWHPAVMKDVGGGVLKVLRPSINTVYYKTNRDTIAMNTVRVPRGLGFIFGFNMADPDKSKGFNGWKCGDSNGSTANSPLKGDAKQPYLRNADGTATLECPTNEHIMMEMTSPICWNGRDLTSANGRDHMAYPDNGSHNAPCPSTHPYRQPFFTMTVAFDHGGSADYKEWFVSSDRMPGYPRFLNGQSVHADWMGAWDYPTMLLWMNHCGGMTGRAEDIRSCHSTRFGEGTAGKVQGIIDLASVPVSQRYMTPPPDPIPAVIDPTGHKHGTSRARTH